MVHITNRRWMQLPVIMEVFFCFFFFTSANLSALTVHLTRLCSACAWWRARLTKWLCKEWPALDWRTLWTLPILDRWVLCSIYATVGLKFVLLLEVVVSSLESDAFIFWEKNCDMRRTFMSRDSCICVDTCTVWLHSIYISLVNTHCHARIIIISLMLDCNCKKSFSVLWFWLIPA